ASAGEPKLWSDTKLASLSSWGEVIFSTSGVSSVGHCVMPGSYSPSQTGQIISTPFNFRYLLGHSQYHRVQVENSFDFKRYLIKMCHSFEGMETIVDLSVRQTPHSLSAKLLHIKRGHHRSKNHCASHRALVNLFLAREVAHETTCERVAGARRIKHRLERVRRNREITVARKERRAVLATLDDQRFWSPTEDLARGFDQVGNFGELSRFG